MYENKGERVSEFRCRVSNFGAPGRNANLISYDRSQYVYENKGNGDKMPGEMYAFCSI